MNTNPLDAEKLNTLIDINKLINSSYSDINALLVQILQSAMRLVSCESSSILLVNNDDTLRFEVALGPKGLEASGILVKKKGSIAGWVVENNESLILDNVLADSRFCSVVQDKTGYKTRNMIAVPMRINDKCVGVIELLNKNDNKNFTKEDLTVIEMLGVQASIAYQNASLYKKARLKISSLEKSKSDQIKPFITQSPQMQDLLNVINKISLSNSIVFIYGETGVGKKLIAEQIHLKSLRRNEPFVKIRCTKDSSLELEREIFGNSAEEKKGCFELASKGTVFFDEISNLSLNLQERLLEILDKNVFDVRFISSSSIDLEEKVSEGSFLKELYYRLTVFSLNVPPLRQRKDDIEPLANLFCRKFSKELNKNFTGFTQNAMEILYDYYWECNVLELKNAIERACILGHPPLIESLDLRMINSKVEDFCDSQSFDLINDKSLKTALHNFKKKYVKQILDSVSWNQTEASKVLEIQRTYLSKMMSDLNIRK